MNRLEYFIMLNIIVWSRNRLLTVVHCLSCGDFILTSSALWTLERMLLGRTCDSMALSAEFRTNYEWFLLTWLDSSSLTLNHSPGLRCALNAETKAISLGTARICWSSEELMVVIRVLNSPPIRWNRMESRPFIALFRLLLGYKLPPNICMCKYPLCSKKSWCYFFS